MTPRDLLFLLIGANAGWLFFRGFYAGRRWLWQQLWARHERRCTPLNERWKRRVVRHPLTGRVGVCCGVCVQHQGWRDLLFPRWSAKVMFSSELVRLFETRPDSMESALLTGLRATELAAQGGVIALPLRELALAPASDVAEFTRRKEEA